MSFNAEPYMSNGLPCLSFGGSVFPDYFIEGLPFPHEVQRDVELHARSVHVHAEVKNHDQRRILDRTIVANDPGAGRRSGFRRTPPGSIPLVTAGEEDELWAVMLAYPGSGSLLWALPAETSNHVEWLVNVLDALHLIDAERYPAAPDWREREDWATPAMRVVITALRSIESEREEVLADLDRRELSARESVEAERADSASGMSRLLTAQSEELVDAVAESFRAFGFVVQDMDDHHDATTGAKLEDLRVSCPSDGRPGWTALVEVKGYSKGARANDVGQILGRPPMAFFKEEGREPNALWHIANSLREQDPSTRPVALSSENDLVVLAANGGCFIDTRDLFLAWRAVAEGDVTGDSVRDSLMGARERWTWPGVEDRS
ncbi:hypothetical protein NYS50_11065 [Curtobacterium flaccumfaciens pv. flaccumfaciens]|uniref:hypothetical protein n=1 Tax=Curtobacterium flaccumfaciens TaxID=2035 RepID=UPI00217D425C|nr:hypothetical protein [Curtobacterium flaccumfaciens]MCS6548418.1 hypothetical protein [Curtobacterium flaccumfaciens pv. flaccumfaciens]